MEYTECEKMRKVQDKSQAIGEFIEWLRNEKDVILAAYHEHDDDCYDEEGELLCLLRPHELYPFQYHIEGILAEYYDIDLKRIDVEKQAMLEEIRKVQRVKE